MIAVALTPGALEFLWLPLRFMPSIFLVRPLSVGLLPSTSIPIRDIASVAITLFALHDPFPLLDGVPFVTRLLSSVSKRPRRIGTIQIAHL